MSQQIKQQIAHAIEQLQHQLEADSDIQSVTKHISQLETLLEDYESLSKAEKKSRFEELINQLNRRAFENS